MSRSVGDNLGHLVGIISTPEIIGHTLTGNDKFILMATDGLFEWLTNEYISNIICDCHD